MIYLLSVPKLEETFNQLRQCGRGEKECQVLWVSTWRTPETITSVIHPMHTAHSGGFEVDTRWLTTFWTQLAELGSGIRVQIHTHACAAFHSLSDDRWPIIHTPGFLSLVIPNFAMGPTNLADAYLAEIGSDGSWRRADIKGRLEVR